MINTISLDTKYSTTKLLFKADVTHILNDIKKFSKPDDKFESVLFLPLNEGRKAEGGLRTKGYFKNSYVGKPLISVVTIVYNGEEHLEDTIKSVINQTYDNVEYIIIDGGSTDGTLDIIKRYEEAIDYWVSEKDSGISNAFNKGVMASTGDIIGIINADDYYNDNSFEKIVQNYEYEIDMYYGNLITLEDRGEKNYFKSNDNALVNLQKVLMDDIYHPTFFISRTFYKRAGLFNEKYKMAMDYEFLSRVNLDEINYKYIDYSIANMRRGGVSDAFYYKAKIEVIKAYKLKYNRFGLDIIRAYYVVIKAYIRYLFVKYNLKIVVDIKRKFLGNK